MRSRRTYLKVLVNLGIMLILLLVFIFVVPRVIIVFMPFVVGWVIALIAGPLVKFFEKTLKIKRKAGSAFVIIAVIALVILAGYLLGMKLAQETASFIGELPDMWERPCRTSRRWDRSWKTPAGIFPRQCSPHLKDLRTMWRIISAI